MNKNGDSQLAMEIAQTALARICVPKHWVREDSYCKGPRTKFSDPNNCANSFVVLRENRAISASSLLIYSQLLQDKGAGEQKLSPGEIRSIREFLGSTTLGDNQFSNCHLHPDPHAPAFNLSSAQFVEIQPAIALEIKGFFMDRKGLASNYTRALFVLCRDGRVLKLFLQTSSQDEFIISNRIYNQIASSIVWKHEDLAQEFLKRTG